MTDDIHAGKSPEELKAEWLDILDGDDPDEFQTPKSLNDGHTRGSAFSYKQGLTAALKGEGASPLIQDEAFHDGHQRMVHAMVERGIEPLPKDTERVLAMPPRHLGAVPPARVIDAEQIEPA